MIIINSPALINPKIIPRTLSNGPSTDFLIFLEIKLEMMVREMIDNKNNTPKDIASAIIGDETWLIINTFKLW